MSAPCLLSLRRSAGAMRARDRLLKYGATGRAAPGASGFQAEAIEARAERLAPGPRSNFMACHSRH